MSIGVGIAVDSFPAAFAVFIPPSPGHVYLTRTGCVYRTCSVWTIVQPQALESKGVLYYLTLHLRYTQVSYYHPQIKGMGLTGSESHHNQLLRGEDHGSQLQIPSSEILQFGAWRNPSVGMGGGETETE